MGKKEENVVENEVVETTDVKETEVNGIKIAEEVVAKIAGIAASEVKGVFGMNGGLVEGFSEIFGKKSFSKGVKVQVTEKDAITGKSYVLIGQTIVEELFGAEDPLGKTIRLKGKPFTIIGILKEKGDGMGGSDQDNIIVMPYKTLRQRLKGSPRPNFADLVLVKASEEDKVAILGKRIENHLRLRHRLKPSTKNDFEI